MPLARYQMVRGARPADDPLPDGIRQDTRKHTRHCLRPPKEAVDAYLRDPNDVAFEQFRDTYLATIEERFASDPAPFVAIAEAARTQPVFLGCSCPTKRNPDVRRCHTASALQWMKQKFPDLDVILV